MLLIDVAAFNGQEVLERCLAFGKAHPPERIGLDQDLLNAVLHGGLGGDLAGLELAVHLGVAALRGDGGRARGAFHRAEEALDAMPGASCR